MISTSKIQPGQELEVRLRIAAPNSEGDFRRQVTVSGSGQKRIDILLEGQVEMPFSSRSTDFAISKADRSFVLSLTSNEGAVEKGSLSVLCAAAGVSLETTEVDGKMLKIAFLTSDT